MSGVSSGATSGSNGDTEVIPPSTFISGARVESRNFTWKIENFDLVRKSDELVGAQEFEFEAGNSVELPTKWAFGLTRSQHSSGDLKNWIGAFLRLAEKPAGVKEVNACFVIRINKLNGEKFVSLTVPFKNMAECEDWGFSKVVNRETKLEDMPLVDGCLVIDIEFHIYALKAIGLDVDAKVGVFENKAIRKLSKDLSAIHALVPGSPDRRTVIKTKENREIPVNRGILSARSKVFHAMFTARMKESRVGVVNVDDISSDAMEVLLHYIYTGTLRTEWKNAEIIEELTYGAQKYELTMLTAFLDDVLGQVCTIDNAKNLATLAKKLGLKKAEADLFNFIRDHAKNLDDLTLMMDTGV